MAIHRRCDPARCKIRHFCTDGKPHTARAASTKMNARACDAHHAAQARTSRAWMKTCVIIKRLPELLKQIETLEKAQRG